MQNSNTEVKKNCFGIVAGMVQRYAFKGYSDGCLHWGVCKSIVALNLRQLQIMWNK